MALLCRFCYASSTPTVRIHQTASATVVATSASGSLNRPGVVVYDRVATTTGVVYMADTYDVAHCNVQNQDLILVHVQSEVAGWTDTAKGQLATKLTLCARAPAVRWKGTVVLVWISGDRIGFWGDRNFHPWLKGLTVPDFLAMINKKLTCR
jgi:hypothetical protein